MSADDSTNRLMKTGAATFLMVAVGLVVAPTLSQSYSHRLAKRLAERIAQVEDGEVKIPLRQLAELGDMAIGQLVAASASERAAVAAIARQIIDEKMTTLEVSVQYATAAELASSAAPIGTALAAHIHEFGPAGKQWAERITLMLVDIADQLPARPARVLLEDCTLVLAAIPPRGPRLRTVAQKKKLAIANRTRDATAPEPQLDPLTRASEGSLEVLSRSLTGADTTVQNTLTRVLPQDLRSMQTPIKPPRSELIWSANKDQPSPLASKASSATTEVSSHLLARERTAKSKQVIDIPTPIDMERRAEQLRKLPTEELFARLRLASFYEAGLLRNTLRGRGFDDRELVLRQRLNSADASERIGLIDDVSQIPAAAARRLLRLLIDDENADVRYAALTALGTANAPELAEVARDLAERDADPRVAELAARLLKQARQ